MVSAPGPVTQLLVAWTSGNRAALEELIPVVYPERRRILVDHAREHAAEKQDAMSSEVAPQPLPEHADYGQRTSALAGRLVSTFERAASAGRCSCYEDSEFRAVIDGVVTALRHVLPNVPCQDFVDERLVSDTAPARFLAELLEHPRIEANRDELTWFISEGRPTHAPHNLQLLRRRIGNVRKVNLSPRTLRARGDSPASR